MISGLANHSNSAHGAILDSRGHVPPAGENLGRPGTDHRGRLLLVWLDRHGVDAAARVPGITRSISRSVPAAGKEAGDWIDQFGFVRGQEGVNEGLPLGINVSHFRPKSGAPSPIPFVGFNCAACHTSKIRRSRDDQGLTIYGMGNPTIDLVAFGDAVKTSLLDEKRLTPEAVASAYEAKYHKAIGPLDKLMITVWLKGARKEIRASCRYAIGRVAGPNCATQVCFKRPGAEPAMKETMRFLSIALLSLTEARHRFQACTIRNGVTGRNTMAAFATR